MRPAIDPVDTVEPHLAALVRTVGAEAVIQQPVATLGIGNQLGVMSRADDALVAVQHHLIIVVEQRTALTVDIRSEERARAAHRYAIGAAFAVAAGAGRAKEIIVASTTFYVGALHKRPCHLLWLGASLQTHAVVAQFAAIDAMERSPEQIFAAAVFNVEGVDAVLNAYALAYEHVAMVGERTCWRQACCHAYAGIPLAAPHRLGIVEHIL